MGIMALSDLRLGLLAFARGWDGTELSGTLVLLPSGDPTKPFLPTSTKPFGHRAFPAGRCDRRHRRDRKYRVAGRRHDRAGRPVAGIADLPAARGTLQPAGHVE